MTKLLTLLSAAALALASTVAFAQGAGKSDAPAAPTQAAPSGSAAPAQDGKQSKKKKKKSKGSKSTQTPKAAPEGQAPGAAK